jgi:hypothetical protein
MLSIIISGARKKDWSSSNTNAEHDDTIDDYIA